MRYCVWYHPAIPISSLPSCNQCLNVLTSVSQKIMYKTSTLHFSSNLTLEWIRFLRRRHLWWWTMKRSIWHQQKALLPWILPCVCMKWCNDILPIHQNISQFVTSIFWADLRSIDGLDFDWDFPMAKGWMSDVCSSCWLIHSCWPYSWHHLKETERMDQQISNMQVGWDQGSLGTDVSSQVRSHKKLQDDQWSEISS